MKTHDMSTGRVTGTSGGFDMLKQFARKRATTERCELCSAGIAASHSHLVEISSRRLLCACDACAVLFSGQSTPKYKRVPKDAKLLTNFHITDAQWDSLMIPINMAFFFRSSAQEKISVLYPSPAGAMESMLSLEAWDEIVRQNPVLREMQSDVEALLVNRVAYGRGGAAAEYYLLPIDECYKLVGIIRMRWRGLSGGAEVWQELAQFFAELKSRTRAEQETHA